MNTMALEDYKGVYVYAQQVDNKLSGIAFELLGKELSGEGTADVRQNVKTCPKCGMTMVKRKGKFGDNSSTINNRYCNYCFAIFVC